MLSRQLRASIVLALCWLAPWPGAAGAQTGRHAPPPTCTGRDLYAEMAGEDPAAHRRIDDAAARIINAGALLWRLEQPGKPVSHLFGTVHLSDARVHKLSAPTARAIATASQIALEVADLSSAALGEAVHRQQALLVQSDGRPLTQLLDGGELASARRALERAGMPGAALELLRPWVVTMALAVTDCERRRTASGLKALDAAIADMARGRRAPVVGLETLDDQLRALAAVPDSDQLTVLRASLRLERLNDDLMETLVRRYLARQLGHIWPLQEELWRRAGFDPKAFTSFQHELITIRNRSMREAALRLIDEQPTFIAVGALHLPGEEGLVSLLQRAGWTVTAID